MKDKKSKTPFTMYTASAEGRIINAHRHEGAIEILQILSGEVRIEIGTEAFAASRGDIFYIPEGAVHRVIANDGCATVRGITYEVSIISENMESIDAELLYMFDVQSRNKVATFREGHPIYQTLRSLMEDSQEETSAKDVCYKLPIRANIYLMTTALLRHYCGSKNEEDRIVYHNVLRLRPAIEYILTHFNQKIYIEELSAMIMVSPDYFTKMFKDSIGKTPIDYINDLRINRALAMLAEDTLGVAEIAERIGFCNANYFHKIFKQYMDMSPLAYRKSTK